MADEIKTQEAAIPAAEPAALRSMAEADEMKRRREEFDEAVAVLTGKGGPQVGWPTRDERLTFFRSAEADVERQINGQRLRLQTFLDVGDQESANVVANQSVKLVSTLKAVRAHISTLIAGAAHPETKAQTPPPTS